MVIEFKKHDLKCEWNGCEKPPTVRMVLGAREWGSISFLYCEAHFYSHVEVVNQTNERLLEKARRASEAEGIPF